MPEYYTLDKSITRDEIETAHYGLYEIEGTRREGRRYEPRENAFITGTVRDIVRIDGEKTLPPDWFSGKAYFRADGARVVIGDQVVPGTDTAWEAA